MKKSDKNESYEEYRQTQITRSDAKWASVTFNTKLFYKILLTALPKMWVSRTGKCLKPERVICLGIRNGNEYTALRKIQSVLTELDNSHIYGVDINPKVEKVGPNCFARDFNKLDKDWEGRFDFLYSNSLDHSFDVDKTLREWHRILKNDRFMLLSLSMADKVCRTDVYSFEPGDCAKLFPKGLFEVREVWQEYGQKEFFNVLVRIIK